MRVEKFVVEKAGKLSKIVNLKFPDLRYSMVQKIIRDKDIKINDKRISADLNLSVGDEVLLYLPETKTMPLDIIYEDENILIVNKPRKIETVSENNQDVSLFKLVTEKYGECFAVHRLDRNTSGLVIFAKNQSAKASLDSAFKTRTIDKFYWALVYGVLNSKSNLLSAFLKKNENKSLVSISDTKQDGYVNIKTKYKVIEEYEDSSLVEVELLTGKTHQIRAHFAHIGHFVIGDEKYGETSINKKLKKHYQCLTAYKIIFHFKENDCLGYLNGKIFELNREKIDFLSK